ncbi:MAG: DUF5675 family protein [Bacteroidia bacterium]|nr:DUF5675 family protein [Bacteroidia bacterium]
MLDFFKKLFRMIFGGGEQASTTENTAPSQESTGTNQAPEENKASGNGELSLELKRSSHGKHDTLGKLYINGEFAAFSMESPKPVCLEAGSYKLSLRKEGGRHASYWYKFGDMHKGMLFLQAEKEDIYPYICIGNLGSEANGSILMGTQFNNEEQEDSKREIWYSEKAYASMYPQIATELEKGNEVSLIIS